MDPLSQATKSLSERCIFDSSDDPSSSRLVVPTLPSSVASFLSKPPSDSRRKLKKPLPDPTTHPHHPTTIWDNLDDYFRPLTLSDLSSLLPPKLDNSFLTIPSIDDVIVDADVAVKECDQSEIQESVVEIQEEEEVVEDEGLCMNWVVGSKHRAILTTERPTKKRKLLGTDAGLNQLLSLPHANLSTKCDVCCLGETGENWNRLMTCGSCGVIVHRKCYGIGDNVEEEWVCCWCSSLRGSDACALPCLLCSRSGGALKRVGGMEGKFAHLFCCLWTPEVYVEDVKEMEPVVNVEGVPEMRTKMVCNVCKVKHGVCVRCSHGTCRTAFHPICARDAKHQMEIWGKFGCNNVELRAFCIKHTTLQDVGSAQPSKNLTKTVGVGDDSSVATSQPSTPSTNKLPKLKLNSNNKEKTVTPAEMASAVSSEVVKDAITLEQDGLPVRLSSESGNAASNKIMDIGMTDGCNSLPNSSNPILVFKTLIGRGKISIGNVALEMGVSSDSLEAAVMGEISSVPSELRLKVIKWLQDSIHMPTSMRHLKFRNGCAIASGSLAARVDCPNATDVTGPCVSGHVMVADSENSDDVFPVKSLPPRRRTKSNIRILKEDNTMHSSGEKIQQSYNGELVDGISEEPAVDVEGDIVANLSPTHNQGCCYKDQVLTEMNSEATWTSPDSKSFLPPEPIGNLAKLKDDDLAEVQHKTDCTLENVFLSKHGNGQADEADIILDDAIKKDRPVYPECSADAVAAAASSDFKVGGSCSRSYVHPVIQKRLIQVQDTLFNRRTEADSNVCSDIDQMPEAKHVDQLAKARSMGILDLSPEDEVEGEMLYLQNRLLNDSVAIKHNCEDIISKVASKLPQELDAVKKQRWDLVLVNQFLREVREAKKRGRKERKHREAQVVLAAAEAAVAASSRNSLLRKDANDEIISIRQESPMKVSALGGRAAGHPLLGPRLKESPRSSVAKFSPDKQSGMFQMPEFSKENALSCDICMRAETLLSRIFVCSSCKVAVHLDCYRKLNDPIGSWKCELCEEMSSQSASPKFQTVDNGSVSYLVTKCGLCGGGTGSFRKSTDGQWVHAFCAEWLLESTFRRGQENPVDGMEAISKERDLLICCICHKKFGACLKCSYGHCQITFHPSCAKAAGFYMNVKAIGGRFHHKAYCEKHSLDQRQKEDSQQYGSEELKNIKQIRVELEKVRLLCERIIKREKVKRDLVLCSHDILATRRDCVAFSVLARNPFFPPGVSSESATTSIDNKSYSETIQRSEDITVDSTVSGKRTVRVPLDMDRKTDDSSTSQPTFKRKAADRNSFSGKQLPQRAGSASFQDSADDGEKRFSSRKHPETFHKEVVMTSHQASMQNQRLPKGFAYVPVGYLSKEKPVIDDSESHEPREPGG